VESVARLRARLDDYAVGSKVTLDILRQGRPLKIGATLQAEN
jgi:S1-C subfamily serine protease